MRTLFQLCLLSVLAVSLSSCAAATAPVRLANSVVQKSTAATVGLARVGVRAAMKPIQSLGN